MLYPLEPLTRDISGIESCSNVAIRQSCGRNKSGTVVSSQSFSILYPPHSMNSEGFGLSFSLATFENCVKQDQDGGWAKIKEFRQILINTNIFHWQSRGPPCPNFRSCVTHAYDQSGWHSNHWIWKVSRNRRNGEIPWIRQGEVTEYGKCLERWGGRTQGMWHFFDAIYLSKQGFFTDTPRILKQGFFSDTPRILKATLPNGALKQFGNFSTRWRSKSSESSFHMIAMIAQAPARGR